MKVSNLYPRNISLCGHRKPHYLKPITQLLSARLFEFSSFCVNSSRSRFWAEACLCSQVWRQKACIASAGTRRTRTTSRNSLIKVTQTHTHTCTESHNLINTLSYLKCNSFHSTSRRLSLFFCRSWFWIIFPRTFECSGVSFETCNQSRRVCVMCAVNSTRRENWFQNLTTQQKCLKRNTWPRGAESNLHTRAGELPGGLLE